MDPSVTTPQMTNLRVKTVSKQTVQSTTKNPPTEQTSIGGISIGNKNTG